MHGELGFPLPAEKGINFFLQWNLHFMKGQGTGKMWQVMFFGEFMNSKL